MCCIGLWEGGRGQERGGGVNPFEIETMAEVLRPGCCTWTWFLCAQMVLEADNIGSGGLPASPISPLMVEFIQETEGRLHVKITDPKNQRWEIPER